MELLKPGGGVNPPGGVILVPVYSKEVSVK